jgi:CRP/FNR family nitrogen fixation transcriptional regulator
MLEELEAFAIASRYHRDEEIYQQNSNVECWYRVISGAARRFTIGADGRRQIVDILLPADFFGFGVRGAHTFAAEAIVADTMISRYPIARIEMLAASDRGPARELSGIVIGTMARLHDLLLILGRTTAEQKVGAFLLYMQDRIATGAANPLALPLSRYDIADYLALSVETVSRALTALRERGVIALSAPREIGIIDRDALADEREAGIALPRPSVMERCKSSARVDRDALADEREAGGAPPAVQRCKSAPLRAVPRTRSVEVRVPPFAFSNVLGDMRRWLDHQRCDPLRFTCVREGSGAVVVRVEFLDQNKAVADLFETQFAAPWAMTSG